MTSRGLTRVLFALAALLAFSTNVAADPGFAPARGIVSDQKAGSVLIYNLYSSSSTSPNGENARLNLTNTNATTSVVIHLFFIDGRSCSVADNYLCLSRSQTTSLLASDIDPDTMGYVLAVAVNGEGVPIDFDYLIGDEYIKLISGHSANLGAEAIEALNLSTVTVTDEMTALLKFDDQMYNALPRSLAVDGLASNRDGNETLLIVNRISGSLVSGADPIGSIFGIIYDQQEAGFSYSFSPSTCQFRAIYNDSFPRTTPRYSSVIPPGNVGWTKFWATSDKALLGAVINRNTGNNPASFNGGHNLHKLTYSNKGQYEIPVFSNTCN